MARRVAWGWLLLVAPAWGCAGAPPTSGPVGCGKDTDCKGERICVAERCTEAPSAVATAPEAPAPVTPVPSPSPVATVPGPQPIAPPAPGPLPTTSPTAEPATPPKPEVSSGGERQAKCGCPAGDLMCTMRCAQQGNAAAPQPGSCDCPPGDLMCSMRCSQK